MNNTMNHTTATASRARQRGRGSTCDFSVRFYVPMQTANNKIMLCGAYIFLLLSV